MQQAPKVCTSPGEEVQADFSLYEFARAFMMPDCLPRIPTLPSPCTQGEAWLRHWKLVRIRPTILRNEPSTAAASAEVRSKPLPYSGVCDKQLF